MWEIVRKSFDKNEVENLTNFVEVRLFNVFLKLSGYKLYIWKEMYIVSFIWFWHHTMCDFPVITPDLVFIVFVTMESNPSQCPFTLDDAFFLTAHEGKKFLNCVRVRLLPMGPRDHMQERSYLTRSFCCLWRERKTLRVWVRLLSMGPRVCIPKRTI